jgi:glutaredoxin
LLLIVASALPTRAWGQFYQYRDDKGNVVISDHAPQGKDAKEKTLRDDGISWSSRGEADIPVAGKEQKGQAAPEESQRKPDYSGVTVVMYRTDWCGYCKQAATYVRSLGAKLVEYDIDKDPEKKAEMRKKSGGSSGVPLIDIDGTIIRGYSQGAIKAAMQKSASR